MNQASFLRNAAVISWLALVTIVLAGCPQPEDNPPASDPAPSALEAASGGTQSGTTEGPRLEADSTTGDPQDVGDPAKTTEVETSEPPAGNDPGPVDLNNPGNGNTGTQASVEEPYTAQQPTPKEPLFVDWPQPKVAIIITGRQHGYIEPCGCTGLANQKGGMARRHTLFKQLAEKGWPLVPIDAGNQVRRFGRQAEIKFQMTASAFRTLGYRAVGLGPDDLRLSFGELVAPLLEEGPDGGSLFVSANVNLLDQLPSQRVIEAGGKKIAVTTLLGKAGQEHVNAAEIDLGDPDAKLAAVAEKLKSVECNLRILLAQASEEECIKWAKEHPIFDIVVSAGSASEPGHDFLPIEGSKSRLINLGAKGMHTVVIGVYDSGTKPLRYQRVPLDDRFADSPEMLKLMASYQTQLETLGLDGLGLRPVNHPSGLEFVGSAACADCHEEEYEIWKNGPHHHATESLVHPGERSEIQRHFDPECLSCHVTGWNPQGYYPYKTGYLDLEADKHLHGNGCENCHGPGSKHVAVENGDLSVDDDEYDKILAGMRLTLEDAKKNHCMTCHDLDNSPDFHKPGAFEEYWKRIEH